MELFGWGGIERWDSEIFTMWVLELVLVFLVWGELGIWLGVRGRFILSFVFFYFDFLDFGVRFFFIGVG